MKQSKRKVIVLTSLFSLLTLTSALLVVLAPPPLTSAGYNSLSAAERSEYLEAIFKTAVAPRLNQWKYIYIHHSGTASGDAESLTVPGMGLCDHFVIGNGNGADDGAILESQRWDRQQPAAPPPGVDHIESDCISICLVGDFDKDIPTTTQMRRLTDLVVTLQTQLRIGSEQVIVLADPGVPSGVGKYFPATAFRDEILP